MSEGEKKSQAPDASGGASVGNLLSNVAPPSGLPTFVTSAVPASQLPPSMQPAARPEARQQSAPPPPATQHTPSSPDKFSPVIPPKKGEPLVAVRSPESSQATPQSATSLPDFTPDTDQMGDIMPGSGLLTWVRGAVSTGGPSWLYRVAEKAKSSVDSMITTLDPQMKEYLNTGGDIHVVVGSDREWDVSPVREAFQAVFGKATIVGMSVDGFDTATAAQAVGAGAAFAAAKHRLASLRASNQQLHNNVPILVLEGFLLEIPGDKWLEAYMLVLSQPSLGIELHTVSQCTCVPAAAPPALRAATPPDYPHAASGLAETLASVLATSLGVAQQDWQEALTGVSRRDILVLAARALAGSYKRFLQLSSAVPPT